MLLQIDKVLKSEVGTGKVASIRTDIVEGVVRTFTGEGCLEVIFKHGGSEYFSHALDGVNGIIGESYFADSSFNVCAIWLLNNEGKTLRKLL